MKFKAIPAGMISVRAAAADLGIHRSRLIRWVESAEVPAQGMMFGERLYWFVKLEDVARSAVVREHFSRRGKDLGRLDEKASQSVIRTHKFPERTTFRSVASIEPLYARGSV
jgi:hypothetical protein